MEQVVTQADILVDSHSGGRLPAFVPVAGFYAEGIDADAAAASRQTAQQMGLAHLWQLPPVPGDLSFEAARRGIAATGAEIGGRGTARPGDVALYLAAYLSGLRHQEMRPGTGGKLTRHLLPGDWSVSPVAGYLRPQVPRGLRVREGECVAQVLSPFGKVLHHFYAGHDGFVMAERHLNTVAVGDLAVGVVRERML